MDLDANRGCIANNGTGVDASVFFSAKKNMNSVAWGAPKLQFIHFLGNLIPKGLTLYYAIGASLGGTHVHEKRDKIFNDGTSYRVTDRSSFAGFFASASIGGEFYRNEKLPGFTQFDISQPVLAFWEKNPNYRPLLQVRTGLGF